MAANPFRLIGGYFGRFFGNTIGEAAAYGIGGALQEPIRPLLQELANETWATATAAGVGKPLSPGEAAEVVAEDVELHDWGVRQAGEAGFTEGTFDAVLGAVLNAPGVPQLLTLWRRGEITDADFVHGLRKAKLEGRWDAPLQALLVDRLDPSVIATAIQRGILDDPGFLPVAPPVAGGRVPAFPVSPLDPLTEAKAAGIDRERLFVETAIVGNPMSPDQAAQATYRGIIERTDFDRAVAEGNTRNEWRDAIFEAFRQILTSSQYVELQIRGFYDRAERLKNTRKHGMSDADSDLLYNVMGRSPSIHTVVVGLARGGKYPGSYANVPEPYRSQIQRSNIREEWAEVVYASRYNYPSPFVLRALAEAGDLGTSAEVEQILLEIGWKPSLAAKVAPAWAPSGTTADKHVAKAETQLWNTLHTSYRADETDAATASATLATLGVSPAAVPQVLALWDAEKALRRKQLTPAQVKKAYRGAITNQDTGQPYTRDDALAALLERGYSTAQANEFLDL